MAAEPQRRTPCTCCITSLKVGRLLSGCFERSGGNPVAPSRWPPASAGTRRATCAPLPSRPHGRCAPVLPLPRREWSTTAAGRKAGLAVGGAERVFGAVRRLAVPPRRREREREL